MSGNSSIKSNVLEIFKKIKGNSLHKLLKPTLYVNSINQLSQEFLKINDIKCIVLDIDNTIVPYKSYSIPVEILNWIYCSSKYVNIILVSNNKRERVQRISHILNFMYISDAHKPLPFCFWKVSQTFKVSFRNVLVIGDQLFNDVLGGNIVGAYTVLVKPLHRECGFIISLKRKIENICLNKMGLNCEFYGKFK